MPEKIRVTQLIHTYELDKGGGVTRAAIEIAQNLNPAQFQVSVCSLGASNSENEQFWLTTLNKQGIRAYAAAQWDENHPYQSFHKAYQAMKIDLSHHPVDILHSHSEFTDILLILLKLERKAPIVIRTTHYGYAIEWRKRPLRRVLLTNFLYPLLLDCEIGVNPGLRDRLNNRRLARLLHRQALYVNEAVRLERFQGVQVNISEKKRSLGIHPGETVIGCVGRLVEQKGYPYLIKAARLVLDQEPGVSFVFVGDGHLSSELQSQAAGLGILDKVIFTGARSDIEQILPCFDIFALASLWEGMPISILESMASRIPVVATDVAGTRDLINPGINGLLVPPADPISLSQAILSLINNPVLKQSLALTALETVQQFSMGRVADRYSDLYHSLLIADRSKEINGT